MDDISYFDYACEKYGFNRKYLHYLSISSIDLLLLICQPNMSKRRMLEEFSKKEGKQHK